MQTAPKQEYDVVVVGSGGGALTAAYLAQHAGLATCVVEKTGRTGGTSAYSGGACWLPGSAVQQRAGLPDSTEGARAYLAAILADTWTAPDEARVEAFLDQAPRLVELLEADDGFAFEWLPFPEYYAAPGRVPSGRSIQPVSVRRDELPEQVAAMVRPPVERDRTGGEGRWTLTGGQALVARLAAMLVRDGGTILTDLPVTGFVLEADGGGDEPDRVAGVAAMGPEGPVTIGARRAVVLGSGGFEGNAAMRTTYDVPGDVEWTMAPRGTNTGEPLEAAVALGAGTDFTAGGWLCPGLQQPDGGGSFTLGFRGGIIVDQAGQRYADECLPYDRFGREMAAAPERVPSYLVFDDREGGRLPAIAMPEGEPEEHLAAGTWHRADTLAELAALTGLPADTLTASVERWNAACAAGRDLDHSRGEDEYDTFFAGGGGPEAVLVPIERPPYTAARFVLSDLGTKGGLLTDPAARVLRADGTSIAGLYAVGNTAASVFGPVYPGPGAPLGSAMVFASLAVQDVLATAAVGAAAPS